MDYEVTMEGNIYTTGIIEGDIYDEDIKHGKKVIKSSMSTDSKITRINFANNYALLLGRYGLMLDRGLNNNLLAEFTTRILDTLTKSLGFDLETTRWSSVTINLDASIGVSNIVRNDQMECYFTSMTLLDSFMVSLLNFVCPRQLDLTRIKNVYNRIAVLFKQI
jgi:hypothetical protein